jgi:hypothetical protein
MKQLILLGSILLSSIYSYANDAWQCTSARKNVTIVAATASYDDTVKSQKVQDAFLKKLVKELDLDALPYKIIVVVGPHGGALDYNRNAGVFASIGYDTVRAVDYSFLIAKSKTSLIDTTDFGATNAIGQNDVGLKIILQHGRDTTGYYDRIFTLVKYGINHSDEIRETQVKFIWVLMKT